MKKIFQPSDFMFTGLEPKEAADIANAKMEKLMSEWPTWYADKSMREVSPTIQDEKNHVAISSNFRNSYYQFKMAFIEPIKREPCKHEPVLFSVNAVYRPNGPVPEDENYKCKHCGVSLEVTWTEKT
jgi:hypothetical protein